MLTSVELIADEFLINLIFYFGLNIYKKILNLACLDEKSIISLEQIFFLNWLA